MGTAIAEAAKAAGDEMLFFVAKSAEGATPQVRKLTGLAEPKPTPQLLIRHPRRGRLLRRRRRRIGRRLPRGLQEGWRARAQAAVVSESIVRTVVIGFVFEYSRVVRWMRT